ncbi:MAG: hypothetical protein WCN92_11665 [Eubacteriales bacterium]
MLKKQAKQADAHYRRKINQGGDDMFRFIKQLFSEQKRVKACPSAFPTDQMISSILSPNKKYLLEWEQGRFRMQSEGVVCAKGRLDDPEEGKIANNGTFIFNQGGPPTTLSSTFIAYSSSAKRILTKRINANLFNNGLSDDGLFAVCQSCNNRDHKDGNLLFMFNLTTGKLVNRISPAYYWADYYQFDSQNCTVLLCYRDGMSSKYSFY